MSSVVTLYVVDYDSMVSGPIDHSEGWGNIDGDVYVGHFSFNIGNIGTSNVYSFLMKAGSSYSELMAGLGYTDVQERERLRAVFRRLYRLVVDLWRTANRPYCHRRKSYHYHYLHMVDIHAIETCSLWLNLLTFVISGPMGFNILVFIYRQIIIHSKYRLTFASTCVVFNTLKTLLVYFILIISL